MEASFYHKEQRLKTCLKVGYLFAFNQYFFFFFWFHSLYKIMWWLQLGPVSSARRLWCGSLQDGQ